MTLSPIYEMHEKRVILFPQEVYEGKNALSMREDFYLGLTAAAMLFPDDAEAFAGYAARELSRLLSAAESQSEIALAHAAPHVMELVTELYGSWANFSWHLHGRGFTDKGKGSLAERVMQGQVCGIIYMVHELSEKASKRPLTLQFPCWNKCDNTRSWRPLPLHFLLLISKIPFGQDSKMLLGFGRLHVKQISRMIPRE